MTTICRFAPSPSGRMHAGNIFSALISWLCARAAGGKIVLRIEDLDRDRCKEEYKLQVIKDFEVLGLTFDEGPYYQQDRDHIYQEYYQQLGEAGLLYPCFCTRADLLSASAPHSGEKPVYAGTCRNLTQEEALKASERRKPASRVKVPHKTYGFTDEIQGTFAQNLASDCGDFVVRRGDGMFAYQLAVVVDDALQGVNMVVRGVDLLSSTPQQLYLQDILGFSHPRYAHIPLLANEEGIRLSKRNKDASLDELLVTLGSPEAVIGHIASLVRLIDRFETLTPEELLPEFSLTKCQCLWQGQETILWKTPRL